MTHQFHQQATTRGNGAPFVESVGKIINYINSNCSQDEQKRKSLSTVKRAHLPNSMTISLSTDLLAYSPPHTSRFFFIDIRKVVEEEEQEDVRQLVKSTVKEVKSTSIPYDFRVQRMAFNFDSSALMLQGKYSAFVLLLASRTTTTRNQASEQFVTQYCRSLQVGPNFEEDDLTMDDSRVIIKAAWHPLSNIHLSVLSSDNVLSIYNLSENANDPEQQFLLALPKDQSNTNRAKYVSKERIVSFVYGGDRGWERFSIFYVTDHGNTFVLLPVVPFRCLIPEFCFEELFLDGTVNQKDVTKFVDTISAEYVDVSLQNENKSAADGTYRYIRTKEHKHALFNCSPSGLAPIGPLQVIKSSTRSIEEYPISDAIILSEKISALILVNSGTFLQALVLIDPVQPRFNRNSKTDKYDVDLSVHEPESITLLAYDDISLYDQAPSDISALPSLYPHSVSTHTAYCVHEAGVHQVNFPFLSDLNHFFNMKNTGEIPLEPSTAIQLLDTKGMSTSSKGPLAFATTANPDIGYYVFIMDSEQVPYILNTFPISSTSVDYDSIEATSSDLIPVDKLIANEVQKLSGHVPTLAQHTVDNKSPQAVRLFVETCNLFQHEYFTRLEMMHQIIQMRLNTMGDKYTQQRNTCKRLMEDKMKQSESRALVVNQLNNALERQTKLDERMKKIRQTVLNQQPLSRAEQEFSRMVNYESEVLGKYQEKMEQIQRILDRTMSEPTRTTESNNAEQEKIIKARNHLEGTIIVMKKTLAKIHALQEQVQSIQEASSERPMHKRSSSGSFGLTD